MSVVLKRKVLKSTPASASAFVVFGLPSDAEYFSRVPAKPPKSDKRVFSVCLRFRPISPPIDVRNERLCWSLLRKSTTHLRTSVASTVLIVEIEFFSRSAAALSLPAKSRIYRGCKRVIPGSIGRCRNKLRLILIVTAGKTETKINRSLQPFPESHLSRNYSDYIHLLNSDCFIR